MVDTASNGMIALELLSRKSYDVVVLDVNMPKMDGLQLLRELHKRGIKARVMMLSTSTYEGAKLLMDALALGALDFMRKPDALADWNMEYYREKFLELLDIVSDSEYPIFAADEASPSGEYREMPSIKSGPTGGAGSRIVAIASSTGGPRALQSVIPCLSGELDAPVLLVQHMPKGFTASLAERLDDLSALRVKEAAEGEELQKGIVYVAMGGQHMKVKRVPGGKHVIQYTDEPNREGVKPCANYMFESLADSGYDSVVCVVMTGMGADGTEGISTLRKAKNTYVIAQNQATCTVYGMPKSVVHAGLADEEVPLEQIAQNIVQQVGVRSV